MKIYGCSVVRNEDDFIETFIKYHSFLDYLIITDNGSTDKTCEIVNSLIGANGTPKVILLHQNGDFDQEKIINQMVERIMKCEFAPKPDIIIPFDADELIATFEGNSIRRQLESINLNVINVIRWRTYMPHKCGGETYLPSSFRYCRSQNLEYLSKVIIPTNLIDDSFRILRGNHSVSSCNKLIIKVIDNIFMAHYPIRSMYQFLKKVITGYAKRISSSTYVMGASKQAERLYEKFIEQGCFRENDLLEEAYTYFSACDEPYSIKKIEECPIDLRDSNTNVDYMFGEKDIILALAKDYVDMAFSMRLLKKDNVQNNENSHISQRDYLCRKQLEEMRLKKNIAIEEANSSSIVDLVCDKNLIGKRAWVCTYSIVGEKICEILKDKGVMVNGLVFIHSKLPIKKIEQRHLDALDADVSKCDYIVVYTEAMKSYVIDRIPLHLLTTILKVKPVRKFNENSIF